MARQDDGFAFELAGGCVALIGTAFVAAALFEPGSSGETGGRLLVIAVVTGVLAALLGDWRAWVGVTLVAALIFVGFLAGHAGDLTSDGSFWSHTLVIGLAALLGRGQRWIRHAVTAPGGRLETHRLRVR